MTPMQPGPTTASFPPAYAPQPTYGAPYAAQPVSAAPPVETPDAIRTWSTVLGVAGGLGAVGLGMIAFLIAGFEGHSAGWELLAIPTGLALMSAMAGGAGGVVALVKKSWIGGAAAIGLAGLGSLLGLVGFVLGA